MKWCHAKINNKILLGAVNAANTFELYELDGDTRKLNCIARYVFSNEELLILSLDWSTGKYLYQEPNIVVSDSKGNVSLFKLVGNNLNLINTCHAHDYEAWIAAFYYWDTNIFFSGGDDSILLKFDVRIGSEPIVKNRLHEAGVTCCHSNANREFIVTTGRCVYISKKLRV